MHITRRTLLVSLTIAGLAWTFGTVASASVIDSVTDAVSTVPAGLNPAFVVVNPVTGYAYISNSNSNTVTVFYGYGEGKKGKVVPVGTGPLRMAINPNTNRTYVANCCNDTVTVIDSDTNIR